LHLPAKKIALADPAGEEVAYLIERALIVSGKRFNVEGGAPGRDQLQVRQRDRAHRPRYQWGGEHLGQLVDALIESQEVITPPGPRPRFGESLRVVDRADHAGRLQGKRAQLRGGRLDGAF